MAIPHKLVTEALELPDDDREELVQTLLASFQDEGACDLSDEELADLDRGLADADRAGARGELIPAAELLARMRRIP